MEVQAQGDRAGRRRAARAALHLAPAAARGRGPRIARSHGVVQQPVQLFLRSRTACSTLWAHRTHCSARLWPRTGSTSSSYAAGTPPAQQQQQLLHRARSCYPRQLTSSSAAVGPPSAASTSPVASARSAAAARQSRSAARLTEHAASRSHSGALAAARGGVCVCGARACSKHDTRRARPSMHACTLDLCRPTLSCGRPCTQQGAAPRRVYMRG